MELITEQYKQTEMGLIPSDWEVKTLGELSIVRDGTHQTPTYVDYGIPFYSVESVTNNNFSDTKYITEEAHSILTKKFKIEKGDILMTRIGSIGDCKLIDWNVNASFYVSLALLKIKPDYLASYILHYSKSASFKKETENNSLQSAIPKKINLGPISNIRVLIPTKAEQSAIARALSDADALITSLEKLITKKRNIKQGAMQKLLKHKDSWEVKQLGDIAEIKKGEQLNRAGLTDNDLYPVINGGILPSGFTNVYNNKGGTIVISEGGNSCGYVNFIRSPFWQGGHCYSIDTKIYSEFLYHSLKYNEKKIMALRVGSGLPNIQRNRLTTFEICLPTLAEQHEIATVLSAMDKEISVLELKLSKFRKIKLGMMQNLLTGKIRLV